MNTRSETTRRKIIDAAYALFSEKGFAKTTTKEIAERASVAELTLFRHFKTKVNIFQQIMLRYSPAVYIEEAMAEIEQLPFREGFERLTQILVTHLQKNRNLIRMNVMEAGLDDEFNNAINPLRQGLLQRLIDYVKKKARPSPPLSDLSIETLTVTYLWSIFSSIIFFERDRMNFIHLTPAQMCDSIQVIYLNSLIASD